MRKVLVLLAGVVLTLCGVFFAFGGRQVIRAMRGPRLPPPASHGTPQTDFAFYRRAVLDNEHGADPAAMARFQSIVDTAPVPTTVDALSLVASEAEAAIGNAHSLVMTPVMQRLPLRVHWLNDGLIIVKADPVHAALLGRRILAIGGRSPDDLAAACRVLVGGGTPGWLRYRSEYFLTVPSALAALGVRAGGTASIAIDTVDVGGERESLSLQAAPTPFTDDAFGEWRQSQPGDQSHGTQGWVTLLSPTQPLPLYQQSPEQQLWLKDLPNHDAVYVRITGNFGTREESAAHFTARVIAAIKSRRNLVLDLRHDWGGDYTQFLGLVERLPKALAADGHVYMVVGPNTFSAGLITASQVKRHVAGRLTILGADVGDALRFRSEGFVIPFPATGIEVYVPTAWDDVGHDCTWLGDCWPPDRFLLGGVGTLAPDLRVANDWSAFRQARDLVMDAVFAEMAKDSEGPSRSQRRRP